MAATSDPLFESLQRLQPMLDAFNKSASELCQTNKNKAEALAVVKELEDYYGKLHKDLLSRYEILNQKESNKNTGDKKNTNKNVGEKTPKNESERKQEKNETKKEENKEAEGGGGKTFGGYSLPKILSIRVRPKMERLCRDSDGPGLRNYLVNNRGEHVKMGEELPSALSMAKDAAVLVLKAIEGYDFSESRTTSNDKKESYSSANRRVCISLLECLFPLLGRDENVVVAKEVQDKAREMARVWKQKMGLEKRLDSASKLDIQAFLQLLATFRIGTDFDHDELCELLFRITRLKQSPALASFLGLSAKMPDFLDKLSKNSKWIEAVRFSHAFGMIDKVNLTDLLKAYLEDSEKDAKDMVKKGGGSESSLNNSTMREISAINLVVKIVKEYNLELLYPLDDLQNKLQRLEQVKEIRKLAAERKLSKGQRHRANKKKAAAEKAGKEASVDKAEKKAAASTQEKNKSIVITPEKKHKAAIDKFDEKKSLIGKGTI
ncbi:hypothetical protein KI387_025103 [Taxus chinensis]|uniref:FRIGIDA-like protein n=1 Tax=Taxus chinensis TaxID=29808 RepID=A0AA38LA27_TAXCH|nr:hypothetical protein KI387_025103 [Taxus chinensis]